jgi:AbrB family looped-hinge helix DNA binding protein
MDHHEIFYGATTVGERGQVVIPQTAREALGIKPGDKLLFLGAGPFQHGLMIVKAEALNEFIASVTAKFNERLGNLEKMIQTSEQPE